MPNPHPRIEFLKPRKPIGELPDEKLGKVTLSIKLGQSVQDAILALPRPERITWMRRTLTEAAKRELIGKVPVGETTAEPGSESVDVEAKPKRRGRKPKGES